MTPINLDSSSTLPYYLFSIPFNRICLWHRDQQTKHQLNSSIVANNQKHKHCVVQRNRFQQRVFKDCLLYFALRLQCFHRAYSQSPQCSLWRTCNYGNTYLPWRICRIPLFSLACFVCLRSTKCTSEVSEAVGQRQRFDQLLWNSSISFQRANQTGCSLLSAMPFSVPTTESNRCGVPLQSEKCCEDREIPINELIFSWRSYFFKVTRWESLL